MVGLTGDSSKEKEIFQMEFCYKGVQQTAEGMWNQGRVFLQERMGSNTKVEELVLHKNK